MVFSRKMGRKRTPRRESPLRGPVTTEDTEPCTPNTSLPTTGDRPQNLRGKADSAAVPQRLEKGRGPWVFMDTETQYYEDINSFKQN